MDFTSEGLVAHLEQYCTEQNIRSINQETRYFLKQEGVRYILGRMDLEAGERDTFDKTLSRRICLEEALAVQMIPARYLFTALNDLPEEAKQLDLVRDCLTVSQAATKIGEGAALPMPVPFRSKEEGPYIAVRKEGIRRIVDLAFRMTNVGMLEVLNTDQRMSDFNVAGAALSDYLNNPPKHWIKVMNAPDN